MPFRIHCPIRAFLFPLFLFFILCFPSYGQESFYDYGFSRTNEIPVWHNADSLLLPWAGGMNSVRFSEIDLNLDGVPDLVAFEKHGNRILPFLQSNGQYFYAPQYVRCFPNLHDWMILKDYNQDGKADIFTYGLAGIAVYKNISQDTLAFELVTEQLTAFYYNGYVNIFASPDDYLVVEDVDNDGKIDILNFWVLGKYVHFLKNYSNDPDNFDFHLESECWGHFAEAADNNLISLFTDCDDKNRQDAPLRHTGSSMLLHDFTGNGLPDVLIGDVDSPHLIMLHNHGTLEEARMTQQDTCYPVGQPVQLYSMPAPALIQLPGQEKPSLLVSPSDPSLTKSQDLNSIWRYDYDTLLHQYTLQSTAFLQSEMIDVGSGCYPILFDWDNDGLPDLFLANYGSFDSTQTINGFLTSYFSSSISYFKNIGSLNQPVFQWQTDDFGHLKSRNCQALYPTFGDFDGDGLTDMLCGQKDGTLMLVSHPQIVSGDGAITEFYQHIDVGDFSTPQYFDLDNDGKNDLLIGNRRGLISYYHNIGTGDIPDFEHVTDSLGQVDVRNHEISYFGYSVPCFYRDGDHGTVLFCGSEQGNVFYYKDIDQNISGNFTLAESNLAESIDGYAFPFCEGKRLGIAVGNLNHDNYPDLFIGNYAGGCAYFEGSTALPHGTSVVRPINHPDISIYPNPTHHLVHIDSENILLHDIRLYDIFGNLLLRTSNNLIDFSQYPAGVYILEINQQIRHKIIKQ